MQGPIHKGESILGFGGGGNEGILSLAPCKVQLIEARAFWGLGGVCG
jgi:hypothetical protein